MYICIHTWRIHIYDIWYKYTHMCTHTRTRKHTQIHTHTHTHTHPHSNHTIAGLIGPLIRSPLRVFICNWQLVARCAGKPSSVSVWWVWLWAQTFSGLSICLSGYLSVSLSVCHLSSWLAGCLSCSWDIHLFVKLSCASLCETCTCAHACVRRINMLDDYANARFFPGVYQTRSKTWQSLRAHGRMYRYACMWLYLHMLTYIQSGKMRTSA